MIRILVPLDGSDFSRRALAEVERLFPAAGCELVLLRVGATPEGLRQVPPRPLPLGGLGAPMPEAREPTYPVYDSELWEAARNELRDALAADVERLRADGYTVRGEAHLGDAVEEIVAEAERGADLVAMATHGRSGLGRLLLGSVAEGVLRRLRLPLLLLRPQAEDASEAAS